MSRNGSGTYVPPSGSWNPAVNGANATSTDWNALLSDLSAAMTQSVSSDGQTPMTGPLPLGNNKITGMADGTANTDGASMNNLYALAGQAGGVGDRNLLINGNFAINQRGYTSGLATTVANQYTLDRWRIPTIGQSAAFAAAAPDRVVTCPASGLEQVIEAGMIVGGVYTLSWAGTATAKVNGVAIVNGGNTGILPINTQVTVQFASGTVGRAQFELGTVATPFQRRQLATELQLCQRYYETDFASDSSYASGGTTIFKRVRFSVTKRVTPTVVASGISEFNCIGTGFNSITVASMSHGYTVSATGAATSNATWAASAEI